eukprot:883180-Heterocapsa_arctica.AAC.1
MTPVRTARKQTLQGNGHELHTTRSRIARKLIVVPDDCSCAKVRYSGGGRENNKIYSCRAPDVGATTA